MAENAENTPTTFCTNCGARSGGGKFCGNCGNPLGIPSPSQTETPVVPGADGADAGQSSPAAPGDAEAGATSDAPAPEEAAAPPAHAAGSVPPPPGAAAPAPPKASFASMPATPAPPSAPNPPAWPTAASANASSPSAPAAPAWPTRDDAPSQPGQPTTASPTVSASAFASTTPSHARSASPASSRPVDYGAWIRPAIATLLLVIALFTPWYTNPLAMFDVGEAAGPSALVVISLLAAIAAAVLPRLASAGVGQLSQLPVTPLRLGLLAPVGLALLIAVVRGLRGDEFLGSGIILAASAAVLIAGMDAKAEHLRIWRNVSLGLLALSVISGLWSLRDLGGLGSLGSIGSTISLFLFLIVAWPWVFAIWYAVALIRRSAPDWAAMLAMAAMLLVAFGFGGGLGQGVAAMSVLLLMTGMMAGAPEGMDRALGLPVDPADRWLSLSASMMTIWAAAGFYIGIIFLAALVTAGGYGGTGALVWLMLLGLGQGVAAWVARSKLLTEPVAGRTLAMGLAAVITIAWFLTLIISETSLDASYLVGVLPPAAVFAMLLLPPSVTARLSSSAAASSGVPSHRGSSPDGHGPAAPDTAKGLAADPPPPAPRGTVAQSDQEFRRAGDVRQFSTSATRSAAPQGLVPGDGNVVIPSPLTRLGARLIDGLIVGIPATILAVIGTTFLITQSDISAYSSEPTVSGAGQAGYGISLLLIVVLGVLYEVGLVAKRGATFGKQMLKLKIVPLDGGGRPSWGASTKRWATTYVLGVLTALSIFLDDSGRYRGWHDKWANTQVVSLNPATNIGQPQGTQGS